MKKFIAVLLLAVMLMGMINVFAIDGDALPAPTGDPSVPPTDDSDDVPPSDDPSEDPSDEPEAPRTGDASNVVFYAVVAVAALAGVAVMLQKRA